jgi:hypothetical protein
MISRWFAPLIFAAAILGWLTAMALPDVVWLDQLTQLLRTAFFSALKMVIAPLIFFSLIAGVMQLRASSQMGRLGGVTIAYYLTTTGIAVLIGLIVVLFYHPWTAFPPLVEDPSVLGDVTAQSARLIDPGDGSTFSLLSTLLQRMLINPFNALAQMNVLGILVGAILFGLAAAITLPTDHLQTCGLGTYHPTHWFIRHYLSACAKNRFLHPRRPRSACWRRFWCHAVSWPYRAARHRLAGLWQKPAAVSTRGEPAHGDGIIHLL